MEIRCFVAMTKSIRSLEIKSLSFRPSDSLSLSLVFSRGAAFARSELKRDDSIVGEIQPPRDLYTSERDTVAVNPLCKVARFVSSNLRICVKRINYSCTRYGARP